MYNALAGFWKAGCTAKPGANGFLFKFIGLNLNKHMPYLTLRPKD
jgi:hypothetical protein